MGFERLAFGSSQRWRHQKRFQLWEHLIKSEFFHAKACSFEETNPLCLFVSVSGEFLRQTQR